MNKQEYLLTTLSEECVEVSKDISKALRFGLNDVNPETNTSNKHNIQNEINDLLGVVKLLQEEGILDFAFIDSEKTQAKVDKVKKWMEYSREQNCLKD